jgi:Carboxypeptidase regulatory-like domain/TonB-dependent Receptor Plug Domain
MKLEHKRRLIRSTSLFFSLVICLACLASVPSAFAQTSTSATLRGTIKDPSGAVVSGATVTIISERTKAERKVVTSDEGGYVFTALTPDTYTIKVEGQGFKTAQQTGITLSPSDTRGVDLTLEVGTAGEVVNVVGGFEPIQKETGAKENTITAKQIDNISVIGRSALELLKTLPGVTAPNADEAGQQAVAFNSGTNANAQYHVNGLRGEYNNVSIDGSRVIDIGSNNGTIITANVDMVQEVKVQSSNYAAEHGSSGVNISATTKGGGHDFHGTLYTYIRDGVLNANDRSNSINGVGRPEETYRYPGGNVGGPIILPWTKFNRNRDKLFFFYGLEIQRQQVDPGSKFDVVPTADMRKGIFPGLDVRNRIDPIGQALINLYPLPNFTDPTGGRNNYVATGLQPINRNQQSLRVDYSISDNTKLFVRWSREFENNDYSRGLWWNPSAYELPSHVLGTNLGRSIAGNLTSVLNPTMTNEFVFSFSKLKLDNDYANPDKVSLAALGIPNYATPFGQNSPYAPIALITSWSGQTSGDFWEPGGLPLFAHNSSLSFVDNLSKISGTHTLKFGALVERAGKIQNFNLEQEGRFIFAPWGNGSTGNVFADILVGRPAQVVASTDVPTGNFRLWNYEFYAQDGWKLRPNFTLEYGLRVAWYPTNEEVGGQGVRFDKSAYDPTQGVLINGDRNRPNGILQAKLGEIPKGVTDSPGAQFAPRLNFAWDINGKGDTVIRGGAGIFYNRVQGNYQYYSLQQPPNAYSATFDAGGFTGLGGGKGLTFSTLPLLDPFAQFGSIGITSADINSINIPRIANMSLSVARRLPGSNVLEVAYVGTQGRHLPLSIETNYVPVGRLLSGKVGNADLSVPVQRVAVAGQASVISQFRPFPAYSSIKFNQYTGTSSYHSLQVTLSHQTSSRFQYFANYTFSKALGTSQTNETDGNGTDPIDTRNRNWGILPYDRTHVFNMTYNYLVPDGARGGFSNWLTRGLLNGWQMSGISNFSSGLPIKLKFSGDITGGGIAAAWVGTDAFSNSGITTGAIAPAFARNPQITGGLSLGERFMDISAIGIPSFGNSGPYVSPFYLRAPHRWNHDISFFKNFNISESQKIQFRAGLFNIFNSAYPRYIQGDFSNSDINVRLGTVCNVFVNGVPNGTGGTTDNVCDPTKGFHFDADTIANFGKVTNKHGHRIIEFALKYYF